MLSLPITLRLLLAAQPELVTPMLLVVQCVVTRHLLDRAGPKVDTGHRRRDAEPGGAHAGTMCHCSRRG